MITTKYLLIAAMFTGHGLLDQNGSVILRTVQSVTHEDGSGKCFNVSGISATTGVRVTIFVRTID